MENQFFLGVAADYKNELTYQFLLLYNINLCGFILPQSQQAVL